MAVDDLSKHVHACVLEQILCSLSGGQQNHANFTKAAFSGMVPANFLIPLRTLPTRMAPPSPPPFRGREGGCETERGKLIKQ